MTTPRVLMCSASMGAEGSVTLKLREAVQAPDSNNHRNGSLDGSLTIGYPDPEILADMLGTLQAAGAGSDATFDIIDNGQRQSITNSVIKTNGITTTTSSLNASNKTGKGLFIKIYYEVIMKRYNTRENVIIEDNIKRRTFSLKIIGRHYF